MLGNVDFKARCEVSEGPVTGGVFSDICFTELIILETDTGFQCSARTGGRKSPFRVFQCRVGHSRLHRNHRAWKEGEDFQGLDLQRNLQ